MRERCPCYPISEEESAKLVDKLMKANYEVAKSTGYSGDKSDLRHIADDLPENDEPPLPISTRTGV